METSSAVLGVLRASPDRDWSPIALYMQLGGDAQGYGFGAINETLVSLSRRGLVERLGRGRYRLSRGGHASDPAARP